MARLAQTVPPDVTPEQEKVLSAKHDEPSMYFGKKPVDSGVVRMVAGLCLGLLLLLVALLFPPFSPVSSFPQRFQAIPTLEVHSAEDLLRQLKANNLWEVQAFSEVPAILVGRFPEDMSSLDAPIQKKAFLHALLPAAMIALSEVEAERTAFEDILAKFDRPPRRLTFVPGVEDYDRLAGLTRNEVCFLQDLCRKYRTCEVADLRRRISPVPVSLIMAQGALESSWGGSRFALERNNLFGVLTWKREGGVSAGPENGKAYSGVAYASLLDSVRAYLLMLNRAPAYNELRQIRGETMDSLALANGLRKYSERGSEYVADLAQLIRSNDLRSYDQCILVDNGGLRGSLRLASLADLR